MKLNTPAARARRAIKNGAKTLKLVMDGHMKDPDFRRLYEVAGVELDVGMAVQRLRESRGWTQAQLAKTAGMAQNAVSRIELANHSLTLKTLQRLAEALDRKVVIEFHPRR